MGDDRDDALAKLRAALDATVVCGHRDQSRLSRGDRRGAGLLQPARRRRRASSALRLSCRARIDVLAPGAQSSLQDLPGRLGYWHVGVPPSGPMDERSIRLANRIVGNAPRRRGAGMHARGPDAALHAATRLIALGGAAMAATLDGAPVALLAGASRSRRARCCARQHRRARACATYLAVRGGFDAPVDLGSRATFTLGGFGGHATGALKAGDVLRIGERIDGAAAAIARRPLSVRR